MSERTEEFVLELVLSLLIKGKANANGGDRPERDDRNGRDRERGASETRTKPPVDNRR